MKLNNLTFEDTSGFILSANEIRQYCDCPRKRYYASRDCLAIRSNIKSSSLSVGKAFHQGLQYYYTELNKKIDEANLDKITIDKVEGLFPSIVPFDPLSVDSSLNKDELCQLDCMLKNYMDTIKDDLVQFSIVNCEQDFKLTNWPINGVTYHGSVDMVVQERSTGKIYFFEHKTCKSFRPEIYDRFDIQLHIYAAYGYNEYGDDFGGMILNQVKKAKLDRGYDQMRTLYTYSPEERRSFFSWIEKKTLGLVSPTNTHEPCNNYMTCKLCEYSPICLKYGYQVPQTTEEIVDTFETEVINDDKQVEKVKMYVYDPREEKESEDA